MSGRIVGAVLDTRMPDHAMKAVAATVAESVNDEGYGWPSERLIAARIQYSLRTVRDALDRLVAGGWLARVRAPEWVREVAFQFNLDRLCWGKPKDDAVFRVERKVRRADREAVAMSGNLPFEAPESPLTSPVASAIAADLLARNGKSSPPEWKSTQPEWKSTHAYKEEPSGTAIEPERENARANPPGSSEGSPPLPDSEPPGGEMALAARMIAVCHPRALRRCWTLDDVPYLDVLSVMGAIRAEAARAGCSRAAAAEMIQRRVELQAREVPREQWRFLKDLEPYFRLREYRMEPNDLTGRPDRGGGASDGASGRGVGADGAAGRGAERAGESPARRRQRESDDALRALAARRYGIGVADANEAGEGPLPEPGDFAWHAGDVPGGVGEAGRGVWVEGVSGRTVDAVR